MPIRAVFRGIFCCGTSAPRWRCGGKSWRNQQSQPSVSSNLEYLSGISSNNDYQWLPAEGLSAHFITAASLLWMFLFSQEKRREKKKNEKKPVGSEVKSNSFSHDSISNFLFNLHGYDADCWHYLMVPPGGLQLSDCFETRRFQHLIQRSFRLPKTSSQLDTKLPSSQTDPPIVLAESNVIAQNKQKKRTTEWRFLLSTFGTKRTWNAGRS